MGADFLTLFDRRTAELILRGTPSDLASIADLYSQSIRRGEPIWRHYWIEDKPVEFDPIAHSWERLQLKLSHGESLNEIRDDLMDQTCHGEIVYVDYWGCMAEVFPNFEPPSAIAWEVFISRFRPMREPPGTLGRFLLTTENVQSILNSLRTHTHELEIMRAPDVARIQAWHDFCATHDDYCVVYNLDF